MKIGAGVGSLYPPVPIAPVIVILACLLVAGCAARSARSTARLRTDIESARAACVEAYAASDFARAVAMVDQAEKAAGSGEVFHAFRRRRAARSALARALARSRALKAQLRAAAEADIHEAEGRVAEAARKTMMKGEHSEIERARSKVAEARKLLDTEPCRYAEAGRAARDASDIVFSAQKMASAKAPSEPHQGEEKPLVVEPGGELRIPVDHWTVSRGECLWRIASYASVYGDPFLWPLIYRANQGQIADPDLIFQGQDFRIPRDATPGEREIASHEARWRVWPTPNYLHDGK